MISFDEFLKQDEADKYNMLLECNAIIQQKENIIKEVREEIIKDRKKNYGDLEKKAFYCNKTDKLLKILDKDSDKE